MMNALGLWIQEGATGITPHARLFILLCGIGLCLWTAKQLSRRSVLVSTCVVLIAIGVALVVFSAIPDVFDNISYWVGVKYPPVLYLVICVLCLMLLILYLTVRLSLVDYRCRRLGEELAILRTELNEDRSHHQREPIGAGKPWT
ncbi:MAG TPA: DUF2304 domain-containing protein [Bryobacteraceae bacterium]|nr:DUF2304 domain-containing protein [Bryobacteraceae bacterium]